MTKVFQILEEEKREAIAQAERKAVEETAKKTSWKERQQTAVCMLKDGEDVAKIERYARLTREEIEEISKEMSLVR